MIARAVAGHCHNREEVGGVAVNPEVFCAVDLDGGNPVNTGGPELRNQMGALEAVAAFLAVGHIFVF